MSLATVSGVVQSVNMNEKTGMWSVKINNEYHGAGRYRPKVNAGDKVTFQSKQNGRFWNMQFGSVKVLGKGEIPTESPATALVSTTESAGNSRMEYSNGMAASNSKSNVRFNDRPWNPEEETARQHSIIMQHSQEMALTFLGFLAGQDAALVPKSAKTESKLTAYEQMLDKFTMKFFNQAKNASVAEASEDQETDEGSSEETTQDKEWE